ncbi:MAG: DUF177 domain-containing protein [Deltaproteobacteria bacterium]|nr:DUF177 domain-containing protein [Deltaproteobacteria bacterium]
MEIRLEDFIYPQITKDELYPPNIVDQWLMGYEGFKNKGNIHAYAHFVKRNANIIMKAELSGNIIGVCSRCLEDTVIPINTDMTIIFLPQSQQRKPSNGEEIELQSDELDVEYYKGNVIDVDYLIRESLILAIPYSPLCSETCKGLCPHCGNNLNKDSCSCSKEQDIFNRIKINIF